MNHTEILNARRETTLKAIQRTIEHIDAVRHQWSHPLKQALQYGSDLRPAEYIRAEEQRLAMLRSLL